MRQPPPSGGEGGELDLPDMIGSRDVEVLELQSHWCCGEGEGWWLVVYKGGGGGRDWVTTHRPWDGTKTGLRAAGLGEGKLVVFGLI